MELLYEIFVQPFWLMISEPIPFLQIVLEGIMSGVLYSLVALGFALIYKASGVFNFAQGMFVVFAALALITFSKWTPSMLAVVTIVMTVVSVAYFYWKRAVSQTNLVLFAVLMLGLTALSFFTAPIMMALILAIYVMILVAFGTERVVLRPLVNQPQIILFMATIGLFFFMEGFGETVFGGRGGAIPLAQLGMERASIEIGEIRLQQIDLTAAVVAGLMVVLLAMMFQYTGVGRALRAVADDHQAALSVGIPLNAMWVIVWAIAGVVALVAGIMWGASAGAVNFRPGQCRAQGPAGPDPRRVHLDPRRDRRRLHHRRRREGLRDLLGTTSSPARPRSGFAYVLALIVLLFRPQGLFGEKIIERV